MRLNQNTMLLGKKVVLVPYTSEHVPRYHEWMKSEELQRLTASEPLTLEQEYAMQCSWQEDADKCTFIVLDAERWQSWPGPTEESCMVGDVNLFLTDLEDPTLGEIEVMIAEPSCRGRGFGTEAALLMMSYALRDWNFLCDTSPVRLQPNQSKFLRLLHPAVEVGRGPSKSHGAVPRPALLWWGSARVKGSAGGGKDEGRPCPAEQGTEQGVL
ncbi:N-acetyltransferase 9 isoform X1 [Fukomys damarensis]|uniref:N-acetyltransferase 9 isoform X1 n=1 Tax=Fukomys damarensis TaxID=885580 RepID=UPI001454E4E6|nr:N-acetyltransferase 9 isoform X1 [Fukomys damarensis]XP_033623679.1 N-acetyltransferase 9 isoform X1 [Fukomys damarensis]XP_033623680.1 N-acetyltransferase 9 isoform X1 [Fukomys damarensis]XP_033623682.1 N-acetyltransferase 9 isoform X1 [Fukomys damarensis]XP_033623683.1 N-acetyltransferase 9 isoform X1 [Fukomys damarensis]XP_033623684.1 N-acetyltransferase 9 isoform X1 [Fukomys damarensis]XP_033623685.1 N-acetyltransferase 9 isoform X1 [Fukomys damarensis]